MDCKLQGQSCISLSFPPLTKGISCYDAVLHLTTGPRVSIMSQESPHPRTWLAFCDVKGPLVRTWESWLIVIDIIQVY